MTVTGLLSGIDMVRTDLTRFGLGLLSAALTSLLAGCQKNVTIGDRDRLPHGIIYILPGIEGRSNWNQDIAQGLDTAGVASTIRIHDWTTGVGGMVINLTDYERNRRKAQELANEIVAYRERFPGRPVHLVGHSGGAGLAVLALEALPPGRQIDAAVLLAPALSPEYDLSTALRRTRYGIWNFYSPKDVSLLKIGTSVLGPIDRQHGVAAGAVGFRTPGGLSPPDQTLYERRLRQIRWTPRLAEYGASGSHIGWTNPEFVAQYVAPLIKENEASRPLRTLTANRLAR